MAKAGISTRLIRFVDTCVGHRKGGIANVCIIVACFFGAISGSGPATVAALGAVLIPAMIERGGFSAAFSTALMATSSSIAIVIPPSIAFVVYASITGVSIGVKFLRGQIDLAGSDKDPAAVRIQRQIARLDDFLCLLRLLSRFLGIAARTPLIFRISCGFTLPSVSSSPASRTAPS